LAESEPWSINTISDPINQILDNTICCDQITITYPFDPTVIDQIANTTVSTQDGSSITSIQWQKLSGATWTNISGANQFSYDPPTVTANTKYRRVLTSSSGIVSYSIPVSITKLIEKITGNSICCSQITSAMPFDPAPFQQATNISLASNATGATFTYQWQQSFGSDIWTDIIGQTNSTCDLSVVKNPSSYRRQVKSSNGTIHSSEPVYIFLQPCDRPNDQQNTICGNMTFYKVQNGDIIIPGLILGSYDTPDIIRREFGYDYMISYDGVQWFNADPKQLLSVNDNSPYALCGRHKNPNPPVNPKLTPLVNPAWTIITTLLSPSTAEPYTDPVIQIINALLPQDATKPSRACAFKNGLLDYQPQPFIFDINKGSVQKIYIRRYYYEWYDPFNCGFLDAFPCGSQWYLKNESNIATITLTTGDFPKPVAPIVSSRETATCKSADQTITFSVPQLNNQEHYKWEIPATWVSYTLLEGPYANQISVNTNATEKNFVADGQVCLTVTQGGQSDRQCKTITGTRQFYSIIPTAPISACEGQTVIIKPLLFGVDTNPDHYTYEWAAYQSPIQSCNNPSGAIGNTCKELKLTIGNVRQFPNQEVTLTTTNEFGCKYTSKSKLIATPGLQMGILNTYNDPKAINNSGLAVNTTSNYLYFTGQNKNIYRTYYDNTIGQQIWKYVPLTDKVTNQQIVSDGSVAYYKGTTDKLFYILNSALFYAESTDNGLTWVDKRPLGAIVNNVDYRIKVYGNNVYYIDVANRKVSYKDISTSNSLAITVGSSQVNYSQRMFTIEDGILAYADINNNIIAYNALSGLAYTINVPANIKQVNFNSSISIYNKNIYYTSSSGALRIIKLNTSTGVYDNYEEVPNLQLAGPFAINKQTGTLYAKAYDVLGKQIYYLNNKWNTAPIDNILSYSPIQSDMTYANGHAYYIGDNGYLSNTYYIAPCIPAVLRTSNESDSAGDFLNEPLTNEIAEDRSVILYPNPATSLVKATFTIPQESVVQIKIIPITGGNTDTKFNESIASGTHDVSFDMSNYAAGVYIVQVYVNGTLYAKSKLIKY